MRRDYQKLIDKYNVEAQAFDSADGLYNGYFADGASAGGGGVYQSQSGSAFSKISDGNRMYTVVCKNTNTTGDPVKAIIFGADLWQGSTQPNAGVTVEVMETSHAQVRAESQRSPFFVSNFRMVTTTNSQMTSQVPYLVQSSSAGLEQRAPFRPMGYRNAMQQITTQIDVDNFTFEINGGTYWEVPLIANETVQFTFYIVARWDASEAVQGNSPIKVANQHKFITGRPN